MKQVVCFTESLGGGGAEHQLVLLSEMLAIMGYDVSLVTYASLPDHYNTPLGVKRYDIGGTNARGKYFKAIIKVIKVFRYFFWLKTDCIISYRQCANIRVLLPMFFRLKKPKIICSDRNTSSRLTFRHKILLHFLYKKADFIVPNSKTQANFICRIKPSISSKLHIIHNYTDLHHYCMSKVPEDLTVIRIGIFSRYSKQKNPIGFAQAINRVKSISKQSFEVHWYGDQKGEIDGYNIDFINLNNTINELDISDVLFLHPSVKDPSVLMDSFHAVCLPSLYEGFSNSIAEGICSGKPMLVSNVSDNSIMVHEGRNGFLFDPQKIHSISDAFIHFFELSYTDMCHMAEESRRIAIGLFNKEAFVHQYVSLIESK